MPVHFSDEKKIMLRKKPNHFLTAVLILQQEIVNTGSTSKYNNFLALCIFLVGDATVLRGKMWTNYL